MKNSADIGGCYPPWPSASVDNTLLDLQNSSYPTQSHSIIAKYFFNLSQQQKSSFLLFFPIEVLWLVRFFCIYYTLNVWSRGKRFGLFSRES